MDHPLLNFLFFFIFFILSVFCGYYSSHSVDVGVMCGCVSHSLTHSQLLSLPSLGLFTFVSALTFFLFLYSLSLNSLFTLTLSFSLSPSLSLIQLFLFASFHFIALFFINPPTSSHLHPPSILPSIHPSPIHPSTHPYSYILPLHIFIHSQHHHSEHLSLDMEVSCH